MIKNDQRELPAEVTDCYSLISELELVVISIIIFSSRRSLQLELAPPSKGRTGRPPSLPTDLPLRRPYEGLCSYVDAHPHANASVRIWRFCGEEGKRCFRTIVLRVVVEKIHTVVEIARGGRGCHCGRPPGIPDDFCPNDFPKLKYDFFLLRFSALLHLNISNNIFILYEPLLPLHPYRTLTNPLLPSKR